jgi:Trk K+ transport system NAD-binding subunit
MRRGVRHDLRTAWLYAVALLREFRRTLVILLGLLVLGTVLFAITPSSAVGGGRPSLVQSLYAAWIALTGEPFETPDVWWIAAVQGLYPLFGFLVVGEGLVRFAFLMVSRRRGEKEWMKVKASTYRDHVVLCGVGHLGYRVLQQLVARNESVVVLEKNADAQFLDAVRQTGAPLLLRDARHDEALVDAGVPHARAIIVATDDDLANMEVAIDARRLNPRIKIVMRIFDQTLASKVKDAFKLDYAFSSSALAAPAVAAMAIDCKVLSAFELAGVPHVVAEVPIDDGSDLAGRSIVEIETEHRVRVLSRRRVNGGAETPPPSGVKTLPGDVLAIDVEAARVAGLVAAGRAAAA